MLHSAPKSAMTGMMHYIFLFAGPFALIAIIWPALTVSHSHSQPTVTSRMAALSRALLQYSNDYDGNLPLGSVIQVVPTRKMPTGVGWAGEIYPYVLNPSSYDDGLGRTPEDRSHGTIVSFAYNRNAARQREIDRWSSPSRTVLLYQVCGVHSMIDLQDELAGCPDAQRSASGDGTYILLMDGHQPRLVEPITGAVGGRSGDTVDSEWPIPAIDNGSYYLLGDGHIAWHLPSEVSSGCSAEISTGKQAGYSSGQAAGTDNRRYSATFSTR